MLIKPNVMTLFDPCQTLKLILRLISTYSQTNKIMHNCINWPIILSVSIYSEGSYIKIHNSKGQKNIANANVYHYSFMLIYAAQ